MTLKDKVCIITGAASGIGYGIATRFVADGAKVVIADLKLELAQQAADALTAQGPGVAMAVEMNVTDEAQVNAGVAQVVEKWGRIDVLISNAGIQIVHRLEDFPFNEWKKLLAIHLDGAFLTSKACLPHMYKAGSGAIIFMGSVHSKEASPLKSAYVTAKHGLLGLARVISKEGAEHGVRANVISTTRKTSADIRTAENAAPERTLPRSMHRVSGVADGVDQGGSEGFVDLAAQATHVRLDHRRVGLEVEVPDTFQQHRARHHAARVAHQDFKQGEFLGVELDQPALAGRGA